MPERDEIVPAHTPSDSSNKVDPILQRAQWWAAPLILCLVLCELGFCARGLSRSLAGEVDFRVFYASGHLVASGQGSRLYQYEQQRQTQHALVSGDGRTLPFLYPPFSALLFVPLASFPYRTAFVLFGGINLCLLWICASLVRRCIPAWHSVPATVISAVFLCVLHVSMVLLQGQVSILLLLFYVACMVAIRERRPFLAGLLLSAALIKLQIALPIIVLFLCWRRWRVIAGVASGATLLAILSLAISGLHGCLDYLSSLAAVASDTSLHPELAHQRYGMFAADMPNLHGIFFFLTHGSPAGQYLFLATSLLLLLWAARQKPSLALALPVSMLVSYHMQAYDLTLLLLPLSIAMSGTPAPSIASSAFHCARRNSLPELSPWPRRSILAITIASLTVPIAPFLLVHGMSSLFILPVLATLWASRHSQPA